MRIITLLACAILLANCSRMASPLPMTSTQSMQSNGAFAVKPAAAWLCGQPPSAERRSEIAPQVAEGYQSLYKFKAGSDGGYPYGALTSFGGNLYGTTDQGGASGYGTVFEMSTAGKERVLYSFKGNTDGAYPCAGLIHVNGKLFGTTQAGGAYGWGTIFDVTAPGQEHIVYSFKAGHNGAHDGATPYAGLLYLNGKF